MNDTTCLICGEIFELEFDIGAPLICETCLPSPEDSINEQYDDIDCHPNYNPVTDSIEA